MCLIRNIFLIYFFVLIEDLLIFMKNILSYYSTAKFKLRAYKQTYPFISRLKRKRWILARINKHREKSGADTGHQILNFIFNKKNRNDRSLSQKKIKLALLTAWGRASYSSTFSSALSFPCFSWGSSPTEAKAEALRTAAGHPEPNRAFRAVVRTTLRVGSTAGLGDRLQIKTRGLCFLHLIMLLLKRHHLDSIIKMTYNLQKGVHEISFKIFW